MPDVKHFGMDGLVSAERPVGVGNLSFGEALREAMVMAMRARPEVLVIGEGVNDSGAIFGTTAGLLKEFGPQRVIESPLSEAATTGICTGAALAGLRPILIHQRFDFALLGMDQLVNHAAKWHYMYAGKLKVPFVLRCLVGKGWGQAAQHSQSLQALFAHIPGLKVVMPSTPRDAKGLLLSAIEDDNPVVFIEARALYSVREEVPAAHYTIPFGSAAVRRPGRDITLIGTSYLVPELLKAAELLGPGIDAEVVDLRSISPLPETALVDAVRRTGLALVADTAWKRFGIGAEVSSILHERCFSTLRGPVERIGLADSSTPCSSVLENSYYPSAERIAERVRKMVAAAGPPRPALSPGLALELPRA